MRIIDTYPLITVERLAESRTFFVERLGMHVVFEASWVVMLGQDGDGDGDGSWGQRRFVVEDPSGIQIDVVEQIEPAPGFWDPYV